MLGHRQRSPVASVANDDGHGQPIFRSIPGVVSDPVDLHIEDRRGQWAWYTAIHGKLPSACFAVRIQGSSLHCQEHLFGSNAGLLYPARLLAIKGENNPIVLNNDAVGMPPVHVRILEKAMLLLVVRIPMVGTHDLRIGGRPFRKVDLRWPTLIGRPQEEAIADALALREPCPHLPPAARSREYPAARSASGAPLIVFELGPQNEFTVLN